MLLVRLHLDFVNQNFKNYEIIGQTIDLDKFWLCKNYELSQKDFPFNFFLPTLFLDPELNLTLTLKFTVKSSFKFLPPKIKEIKESKKTKICFSDFQHFS